jgi:hypothetical protein
MYTVPAARAWWPAVGAPLERGVRPQWRKYAKSTHCSSCTAVRGRARLDDALGVHSTKRQRLDSENAGQATTQTRAKNRRNTAAYQRTALCIHAGRRPTKRLPGERVPCSGWNHEATHNTDQDTPITGPSAVKASCVDQKVSVNIVAATAPNARSVNATAGKRKGQARMASLLASAGDMDSEA